MILYLVLQQPIKADTVILSRKIIELECTQFEFTELVETIEIDICSNISQANLTL